MDHHATKYLEIAIADARVVELRHENGGRWVSGLFNNLPKLKAAIAERSTVGNLYCSLNRASAVRAPNTMHTRALRDEDVDAIVRIPFDFDPVRPAGSPSTRTEIERAIAARDLVVDMLSAYGWPAPALAISGNGAHVVFRARIVADLVWRRRAAELYAGVRTALHQRFDELGVIFDTTVRNPGRIFRLYGSVNRKGEASRSRPHRLASIVLPEDWVPVPIAAIEGAATALSPVIARTTRPDRKRATVIGRGDYSTLDLVGWFTAHDAYIRELAPGKHAVQCPWQAEHTSSSPANGSDTVVWGPAAGWPQFHCAHAHCVGRGIADVLEIWSDADAFCSRDFRPKRPGGQKR
jgi:hypothetical protein